MTPELKPHVPKHEWLRVRVTTADGGEVLLDDHFYPHWLDGPHPTTGDLLAALEDWLLDNAVHWPSCGEPFPEKPAKPHPRPLTEVLA